MSNRRNVITSWIVGRSYFAMQGRFSDMKLHKHQTIQICLPLEGTAILEYAEGTTESDQLVLVGSNVKHALHSNRCFIIMLAPESHIASQIVSKFMNGEVVRHIAPPKICEDMTVAEMAMQVFAHLADTACFSRHIDRRISSLVEKIEDDAFSQNIDVINMSWVLNEVALSESRFLHLFSQQMGIPWRPYLLWRRLLKASQLILSGRSATESAIAAGFADSSHLSRTFKSHFGIALSRMIK